jgi:DNA polymerase-1
MVRTALDETRYVGLDTETTGLDPRKDSVRLLSLDLDTTDGGRFTYVVDCFAVDPTPLFEVLGEKELIIHNAAFDLAFLNRMGLNPGVVHDTMLYSQLLHGTRQKKGFHGLAECADRELGRGMDKTAQTSDWSGPLSTEQIGYAAGDASVLLPLFETIHAKLQDAGLAPVAEIEQRCLPATAWVAESGVPFDLAA